MKIAMVMAAAENGVIGKNNQLPWHLPADLRHFRQMTGANPVIMGRKTYDSVGKPLPGRRNIIITRKRGLKIEGCEVVHSLADAIALAKTTNPPEASVVGGAEIFREAMGLADLIYLTRVHAKPDGDAFFEGPDLTQWKEVSREDCPADAKNPIPYSFITYERMK